MGCANGSARNSASPISVASRSESPTRSKDPSSRSSTRTDKVGPDSKAWSGDKGARVVMGKYRMNMGKEDIMGEGTSSICRKATNIVSGEAVAIKVYKSQKENRHEARPAEDVKLQKFRRQIQVLKELQEPFKEPADPHLWSDQVKNAKPSRLFMQLVDFSQDASGAPGPDPTDGVLYVVTELAQYSLKDYLAIRRDQSKPLPKDSVRNITKAITLVMAGLHAKGLVHIDLKPENLMMFEGRLKLIDVDGCVRVSTPVSIQDSSISFSPCYCAPEWAKFLIEDSESKIAVSTALDVWSLGMTICELVTLDAILKPMYANFLRNGHSHREAGFLFMDWLSSIKKAPIPKTVERYDPEFVDLLVKWLLVLEPGKRRTCAESLSHPYFASAQSSEHARRSRTGEDKRRETGNSTHLNTLSDVESVTRNVRCRVVDNSSTKPVYKGALFKLDADGDLRNNVQWRRRDMWIASNGSLCYWSIKDNKRLVLIDGAKLPGARIEAVKGGARDHAFSVHIRSEEDAQGADTVYYFACEDAEEYGNWTSKLRSAVNMDEMIQTMRLGANMKSDLDKFRLNVKNRRLVVSPDARDGCQPVFKAKLWKVKAEGNRMKQEDWFEREMWLAKNGSLVYWSKKEERELVYYTTDDLIKASIQPLPNEDSFRPWSFQVQLPGSQDIEFAPGEFAAETEDMRNRWMAEFKKFQSP